MTYFNLKNIVSLGFLLWGFYMWLYEGNKNFGLVSISIGLVSIGFNILFYYIAHWRQGKSNQTDH